MYSEFQLAYLTVLFMVTTFSVFLSLKKQKEQEFLYIYLIVSCLLDFLMFVLQKNYMSTAKFGFLYNIYILFCALFFLVYFNKNQSKNLKILNRLIFTGFLLVFSVSIFHNFMEINQIVGMSFAFLYILYSLSWFYGKIMDSDQKSILDDARFWVSGGLLFWGVFFILRIIPRYLFSKVDAQFLIFSQSFFFFVNIIFYSLLFVSLLKYKKKQDGYY